VSRFEQHAHVAGVSDDFREIAISDSAADEDSIALRNALHEFNFESTGYRDGRALSCFLRNGNGVLVAGIDGFTWGGYARIEYLWVDASRRRRGIGTRLLTAAESEARRRGCLKMVLDTHSFQAPGLYRSRGYQEVGTTLDTPIGFSQTLFEKPL
jgi:ribosomal protein S18 acetylase RimI-like enzyme